MRSGLCILRQGSSPTQLPKTRPEPELTLGSSVMACFLISVRRQSQTSPCQTIMGWHFQCHLPMHPPPRGPRLWSVPPAIISHPAFKAFMTAQIQAFLHANTALSRAAMWDQLKVHVHDAARNYCFTFFFFFFWVGEQFISHTWTCNERNHKCQTEGHPQPKLQATLTTWVEADTKVCKEATCQAKRAAHKAVVHQPTAKLVPFLQTKHHLCLNQPNVAVKITSIMKCQAKQAADKTVAHHQYAKLASFH